MIPKKLHYCWFGRWNKWELFEKCYASREKYCADREIIERNEDNIDIESHPYMKKAYENKHWAFVSDYARLLVLKDQWWVYVDTDMELIKPIDEFLKYDVFQWYEDRKYINCAIIGSVQNNDYIAEALGRYTNNMWNYTTIPKVMTATVKKIYPQEKRDGNTKEIDNMLFLSSEYFYPYHFTEEFCQDCITDNTYGIHWWNKSWDLTPVWKRKLFDWIKWFKILIGME